MKNKILNCLTIICHPAFLIFMGLFFTHVLLLHDLSEEFIYFHHNNLVDLVDSVKLCSYLFIYSLFPGGMYFLLVSCFRKFRYLVYPISTFYLLLYLSFVLFNRIYKNHSGIIPRLDVIFHPQEVAGVFQQILIQFVGVKEWLILFIMLGVVSVSFSFIKNFNRYFCWNKKKIILFVFFFILNLKGPIHQTVYRRWPWQYGNQAMLDDSNEEIFRQGFLVFYLWRYSYDKIFHGDILTSEAYPGSINQNISIENHDISEGKYNIITIQVESLAKQVIDLKIGDREVAPFLNSLKRKSLYFPNFYSQHGGGYSGDAELSLFLSMLPLDTHLGLNTAKIEYIKKNNLISILNKNGYQTSVMHANKGTFFNREKNYTKLGINRFWFGRHYKGKASGFFSKDKDFFIQSLPKIKSLKKPFFAHVITVQSHGPFKNYNKKTLEKFNFTKDIDNLTRDYLASIHEVDAALKQFFKGMEEMELLKNTVVFLYSDHQAGVTFKEKCPDECIPLFIYSPSLIKPKINTVLGTHLDLAPTMLDIFDLETKYYPKWFGSSLLRDYPAGKIALLPRYKGLILKKGETVVTKMKTIKKFLNFYRYRNKILR